jgi:hypothetical protein
VSSRFRRTLVVLFAFMLVADLIALAFRQNVALFIVNAFGGCFPWSPRDVQYYPGMTLCPGQTAHTVIVIEVPASKGDRGI